jgi:hypothetical protein
MSKQELINLTLEIVSKLPSEKILEVKDFADFMLKKLDDETLQKGLNELVSKSKSYEFLSEEEDLYTVEDLKEKYIS